MIGPVDAERLNEEIRQLNIDRVTASHEVTKRIISNAIKWKEETLRNHRRSVKR